LLIQLGAGSLSALCFAFSWRALQRCRAITTMPTGASPPNAASEGDSFEQRLAERESNTALNMAKRNVKGLAQAAFTGGLGLFFLALTGGSGHHRDALGAFTLGSVGAIACLAVRRRIGYLADSWRDATNRRRRRQGVDQPERTG
jgi:hypothetical protein